jgi:hypothetical protein
MTKWSARPRPLDELIERTRDFSMSPEQLRAQGRSFAYGNTAIANTDVAPDIMARVDTDFDRSSVQNDFIVQGGAP